MRAGKLQFGGKRNEREVVKRLPAAVYNQHRAQTTYAVPKLDQLSDIRRVKRRIALFERIGEPFVNNLLKGWLMKQSAEMCQEATPLATFRQKVPSEVHSTLPEIHPS